MKNLHSFLPLLILFVIPVQAQIIDLNELYKKFSELPTEGRFLNNDDVEGFLVIPFEHPQIASCNNIELMELNKIRVLFALFYNDNINDDALLKHRDLNTIAPSEWKNILSFTRKVIKTEKLNFKLFLNTLIEYHNNITQIQGWEKKLDSFVYQEHSETFGSYGQELYDLGFSKNQCFSNSTVHAYTDTGRSYVDININLELAMYSFWYRRYVDGSMDTVYQFLSSINNH